MPQDVNRRRYDRSAREAASASTRQRIVDAARSLIIERGYRGTTIASVAQLAGVNHDTVYELVGRKPLLLREVIEQAISGTDHAVAAEDRDYVKAIHAEPDPAEKLAIYAKALVGTHERLAPLFLAARDASSTEPEARQIWDDISRRRAANMRKFAGELRDTGALRSGLSVDEAADTIWATNSPELFVLLTVERRWSTNRYQHWLADTWKRLLLDP